MKLIAWIFTVLLGAAVSNGPEIPGVLGYAVYFSAGVVGYSIFVLILKWDRL